MTCWIKSKCDTCGVQTQREGDVNGHTERSAVGGAIDGDTSGVPDPVTVCFEGGCPSDGEVAFLYVDGLRE